MRTDHTRRWHGDDERFDSNGSREGRTCPTRALQALALLVLASALVLGVGTPTGDLVRWEQGLALDDDDDSGRAPHPEELAPSVEAAFQAESYAPGSVATIKFFNRAPGVRLQIFHTGAERAHTVGYNEMRGVPVSKRLALGGVGNGRTVRVEIGSWPSGMYFARLDAADGRAGFAPFVLRPRRLGEHRVAVVMPTHTWQAYNIRDDNRDGLGDSWYARWDYHRAALYRPYLNRGVPYNFRTYDLRFLHWLTRHDKQVDFLADDDLDRLTSRDALARAYDLIVYPGHHEYVTTQEYDAIEAYRDRGGNLMFLSANNFFWQVVKHGTTMARTYQWRELRRPEAALIGIQYTCNKRAFGRYVVMNSAAEPWLFAHTGLRKGSEFGHAGIEIDQIAPSSPRNIELVARVPNVFGPHLNADMTLYHTKSGGLVFAAGAFTLAAASLHPVGSQLIENLWTEMTSER